MKIRTKFAILPSTLAAMLIISLFITLIISNSNIRNQVGNHLLTTAQSRANHVETLLHSYEEAVQLLAVGIPFTNVLDPQIDHTIKITECNLRIKRSIETNPAISRIRILNKNGIVIASSQEDIGFDISEKAVFIKGSENVYVGEIHKSVYTGDLVLSISAPIFVRNIFSGVLIINFDAEKQLYEILTNRTGLGETGDIYLVNKDGYIITPSRFIDNVILKTKIDTEQVNLYLSEHLEKGFPEEMEEKPTEYLDYRGKKVIGVHYYISEMQWGLIAEFDIEEAYKVINKQTILMIIVLSVLLIVIMIAAIIISKAIVLPITKLRRGTEEIIQGNLDYKIGIESKNEIGQLSRSFDIMTRKLRIAQNKLKNYTEELESKVQKRTAELQKQFERSEKQRIANLVVLNDLNAATKGLKAEITERKQTEEEKGKLEAQLTQAQKMEAIGTLAGGVAHDFNNLLGVIIGYSDYLLTKLDREDQMHKIMQDIRKAGQRGAGLTDQLLAFSRKQAIQPEMLALNGVVAETEKILGRLIGEDIELTTDLEPNLWQVEADQGQITQILMNFSVNARDAMADGGKIVVKTENVNIDQEFCKRYSYARPGRFVCLSIEDTGTGMDQETMSHIFEPFFTTKEIGRGTGLGLSVIFGLVKQHQGWVNVYSEPGQGSIFRVYLPASFASEAKQAEEEVSIEELQGHGERVLLVEDEEMLREFAVRILSQNGYAVFAAANAEEALELFEREKGEFHIIFSDVVLPGINGIELVDRLLVKKPELKVLLSSGYMDDKSRLSVIQEKEINFLQKPYTLTELLKSMKKALH